LLSGLGGTRRPQQRAKLITSVATLGATFALFLAREAILNVVSDTANSTVIGGPLWVKLVAAAVLAAGLIMLAAPAVARRRNRAADDAPAPAAGPMVLPLPSPTFVGRQEDLARVVELVREKRAVAIVGRRAVGTSALALRAAHQVTDRFPDGQVHFDVRGFGSGAPLSEARVLRRALRQLGLPEPQSDRDDDLDAGADTLHAWLTTRRVLLLLDNVDEPRSVHRLLPSSEGSRVLLAGSVSLERLPGVQIHDLHELAEDEAVQLLSEAGDPALVDQDRAAAVDLVNRCGRQPLAIRLLGQMLRDRRWPLRRIVQAVDVGLQAPPKSREAEESVALRPLWDACDVTYRDLSAAQRKLFRVLALVPNTEIGAHAAAVVTRMSPDRASRLLAELVRRGLIESDRPGHYRIRQMLATSGRLYIEQEESARQLDVARARLARYYAVQAEEHADPLLPTPRRPGQEQERARVMAEARSWFHREHELLFRLVTSPHMVAPARTRNGAQGQPRAVQPWLWRLATALCTWYSVEVRLGDWQEVCETVLRMPLARANPATTSWARNQLGVVHRLRGDPAAAWTELDAAAKLSRSAHNRGLAQLQTNLGLVLIDQGQLDLAVRYLETGLELRSLTNRHGQAISALGLGVAHLNARELDAARRYLSRAANTFDAVHDERGLAATLNAVGVVLWDQDDRLGAEEHWMFARSLYAEMGDELGLACVLLNIGAGLVLAHPDQAEKARELLAESLRLRARHPENRGAGLAHLYLGDAHALCDGPEPATRHWREAVRILAPLGGPEAAEAARRPTS
jgi:tetratricopeptide (TPR) repeat protein